MEPRRRAAGPRLARLLGVVGAAALAVSVAASGAGAHDDGTTAHLWLDHLKPMKSPGVINTATNPLDWTKLKDVPPGIADGEDGGVETAGFGLSKLFDAFLVDARLVQRRLSRSCAAGQAIRSIDSHGAPTCTTGPIGESLTLADTGAMCNNDCTEGTLVLTPGTWAISGQIVVRQSDVDVDWLWVDCHLDAGGLSDNASYRFRTWGAANLPMQLVATLSSQRGARPGPAGRCP